MAEKSPERLTNVYQRWCTTPAESHGTEECERFEKRSLLMSCHYGDRADVSSHLRQLRGIEPRNGWQVNSGGWSNVRGTVTQPIAMGSHRWIFKDILARGTGGLKHEQVSETKNKKQKERLNNYNFTKKPTHTRPRRWGIFSSSPPASQRERPT